jgi:hypothetical protein
MTLSLVFLASLEEGVWSDENGNKLGKKKRERKGNELQKGE